MTISPLEKERWTIFFFRQKNVISQGLRCMEVTHSIHYVNTLNIWFKDMVLKESLWKSESATSKSFPEVCRFCAQVCVLLSLSSLHYDCSSKCFLALLNYCFNKSEQSKMTNVAWHVCTKAIHMTECLHMHWVAINLPLA